ncbi:MAG: two-component system response regulator [endosymbiont of Galathealinum brachiosum]|uniref:cyclic-guanylate-specific phosphodiesterase n=1 Tax=endosymbiont of Galathealinum brachiosum TaxID=2200906 RepID=A0A370DIQ7_9GAMM|nr:MAG: two-component system response regulator [endosymbiont of Galathealinum brachiosum]
MPEKTNDQIDTELNSASKKHTDIAEKILIVDDEKLHQYSLMELMKQNGYDVECVSSGDAAIDRIQLNNIGIVLLDLNMDGINGEDVMRFISENNINTTIIVVSGETSFEAAENALKHGAYDYIRKPYSIDNLLNSVNNATKKRQLESDNHKMHIQLRESEKLHRYIVNKSPDIVYILDGEGRFTFINKRIETLLGYKVREVIGKHYTELVHDDDKEKAKFKFNERRTGKRASINIELKLKCKNNDQPRNFDNRILPIEINSVGVYNSHDADPGKKFIGTYGIARDITDRIEAEEIIRFQAYHDMLTRLPNRTLLNDRLSQALTHARRNKSNLSVMFLDLDRFKMINDTLGHIVGDHLLQAVAMRLRHCLREGDTLARLGGDEFTLLLPEVQSKNDAELVARKIIKSLTMPFKIDNHELFVSTSIGISHFPEDGDSIESLIKHADIAMYSVKGSGKNGYQFYDNKMINAYSTHLSLENDLRRALEDEQFEIYYQPQINIETREVFAMEALIRWNHPERGLISPGEFIELAEETRLIKQIGHWMLHNACAELKHWRNLGLGNIRIAINVSAIQLEQNDFVDFVLSILHKNEIPGENLEIEITENTLMHDTDDGILKLRELSSHGIKIAIDDFGTGYSSLNYLKRLPIDTLKIDQSFIRDMSNSDEDSSIIKAIIAMAKGLKLNIISEGVETEAQSEQLREWRCKNMQGFLFGRPMPCIEALDMLKNNALKKIHVVK